MRKEMDERGCVVDRGKEKSSVADETVEEDGDTVDEAGQCE